MYETSFESILLLTLFFIILITPLLALNLSPKLTIISPSILLSLAIMLYELPKFSYYLSFGNYQIRGLYSFVFEFNNVFDSSLTYLIYTIICVWFGILSELILRSITKDPIKLPDVKLKTISRSNLLLKSIWLSSLFCLFLSIVYLLISSKGDLLYFLTARAGNSDAQILKSSSYIFILMLMYCLCVSPYLITKKIRFSKVVLLISCIFMYLYTGSRGFIIYALVSLLFCKVYNEKKVPYFLLIGSVFLLLLMFSFMGVLRKESNEVNLDSMLNNEKSLSSSTLSSYQLQLRDELIFSNIDKLDDFKLKSVFSPILMLFPRAILGDLKPKMIDGVVAKKVWGRDDVGLPINLSTELILNFGYGGFLYLLPLIGFLIKLQNISKNLNATELYISVMIISQTFLSSKLVYSFQIVVLIILFFSLGKLINASNK